MVLKAVFLLTLLAPLTHALTPVTMGQQSLMAGLGAAYSFSESSGTTTVDRSGNGNTLTFSSGGAFTTSGYNGRGAAMNNGTLNGGTPRGLVPTKEFTMMGWVYPTSDPGSSESIIVSYYNASYPYYLIGFDYSAASGQPSCGMNNGAKFVAGPSKISLNVWTHIACTYDGANVRLYVNGTQVASSPYTATISASGSTLYVGDDPGDLSFPGSLDDIRIFIRALSPGEINVMMNTPVAP